MGHTKQNIEDMIGAYPVCSQCGKPNVVRDAWAQWNLGTREWVLKTVFDHFVCDTCGCEISPVWKLNDKFRQRRIQRLNDALRKGQCEHASIVITAGLQAKGQDYLRLASAAVSDFDKFSKDNDPNLEHDFGSLKIEGDKLFWKIDYYDLALKWHSPDAANPAVTHRVLTIMLAHEY